MVTYLYCHREFAASVGGKGVSRTLRGIRRRRKIIPGHLRIDKGFAVLLGSPTDVVGIFYSLFFIYTLFK